MGDGACSAAVAAYSKSWTWILSSSTSASATEVLLTSRLVAGPGSQTRSLFLEEPLADANKCIEINPAWTKGCSRLTVAQRSRCQKRDVREGHEGHVYLSSK